MHVSTKRRLSALALLGGAALGGIVTAVGAATGDAERVTSLWVGADVAADGHATVTEVIDYDFGANSRRGIFRVVPDLPLDAEVDVESPTAPDDATIGPDSATGHARIRVGDPDTTITGRHRYRLAYDLPDVVIGDEVSWNAVGTTWEVGLHDIEVHLRAPFELVDPLCHLGAEEATGGCSVEPAGDGGLRVRVDSIDPGEGLTIDATRGSPLDDPAALPVPPTGAAEDPGAGLLVPALVATATALVVAVPAARATKHAGYELVAAGGAADAAYAEDLDAHSPGVERVDAADLHELATIEFVPPPDLRPPEGGVVLTENVQSHHKVAWLLDAALRDEVVIEGESKDDLRLRRGPALPAPDVDAALRTMFDGRTEIELGSYDEAFAKGWNEIGSDLQQWRKGSGLWSAAGDRRRRLGIALGAVALLVGLAGCAAAGVLANRVDAQWVPLIVVPAIVAGLGVGILSRTWELHVRTPRGTALWLRTESFRRFLADSEASHVEWAAEQGLLREYTAWAVALGEVDHWTSAVEASSRAAEIDRGSLHFAAAAPILASAASTASTAPSSSGGGGGVGGGAGGGGGGSW